MSSSYEKILAYVQELEIVDTHEHLMGTEAQREHETDVLQEYLTHYFNSDLRSAGLSKDDLATVIDHTRPLMERWDLVEPYWERARYTGYGRALDLSAQGLYGIDGVRRDTIEALNDAFLQTLAPGHYRRVLKQASRISVSLLDTEGACDAEFFRPVVRLDRFIWPRTWDQVLQAERSIGHRVRTLEDWTAACEMALAEALKAGAVAIKNGLAYERSLYYARPAKAEAEDDLHDILAVRHMPDWSERPFHVTKAFQDWMMHQVLEMAERAQIPVQVHTGIQEGSGNILAHSDPLLLNNLFIEYPDVDFDLFHIGYPFQHVLSALAKSFPNVYIDMCWAHIISPTASVNALVEWIDSVPLSKISAFGGDYGFVDAIYGHQLMARQNVSRALAIKVDEGLFNVDKAREIARMLFVDNPTRLFALDAQHRN